MPIAIKKYGGNATMGINGKQELQIETMGKVVQSVIKLKERKNKIVNSRLKTL